LARVAQTLSGDDVEMLFPRPMAAAHCHDHRLGRALEALWTAGLDRVDGAVLSRAIQPDALALVRLPTETTSLKGYGADEPDEEAEGPLVTLGDRRDHRPDRKPLRLGRTGTADGVPVWGHVTDGHGRDSPAPRVPSIQRRQHRPDWGEPLLVADRTCVAGEPIALAAVHRLRFVTLVPQTVGLRQEVVDRPELRALPWLGAPPGRRPGPSARDHGASVVRPSRGKTAAGEGHEVPLRLLVVASTHLAKAKAPRLAAAQHVERAPRAPLHQPWQRRACAWEAEAHPAATLCLRELALHRHHLTFPSASAWVAAKRAPRGRPSPEASRPQRHIWRVIWQLQEATDASKRRAQREGRCVLATNVRDAQPLAAADLLRADKGPPAVELRGKWATKPAAMAPIFLETPTRIVALGGVDVIARLVYTLVERQVRTGLAARGETLPDRPAPSQRPTARTVFHLMRTLAVVILQWTGGSQRHVTMRHGHQLPVLRLLGDEPSISTLPRRNSG
jgi:hypothetical protein